ncbi:MAG TPA: hypothetical protein VGB43_04115, partial [Flavobacterium sp.]
MIIRITILLLFNIAAAQVSCNYNNRSVYFGERTNKQPEDVIRIYLDKEGSYYPRLFITDSDMKKNCSSLKDWYHSNPDELEALCANYQIEAILDFDLKVSRLNLALAKEYADRINLKKSQYEGIDILIHGFRKKAFGNIDHYSRYSSEDYEILRSSLTNESKTLFIEVYWDGKYVKPRQSLPHRGFKVFEQAAIPNAD